MKKLIFILLLAMCATASAQKQPTPVYGLDLATNTQAVSGAGHLRLRFDGTNLLQSIGGGAYSILNVLATTQNANLVLAGPSSGVPASPTFRSLVAADLPTTTVMTATIFYSIPAAVSTGGFGVNDAANFSTGNQIQFTLAATVSGAQFYWNGPNVTEKCSLWSTGGVRLASGTVATTGTNIYTCVFTVPFSASAWTSYWIAIWDTGAARRQYTGSAPPSEPGIPFLAGPNLVYISSGQVAGDAQPVTAALAEMPIQPTFTVP